MLYVNVLITRFKRQIRQAGLPEQQRRRRVSQIVEAQLGHADIAMTFNRYSHVTPDMQWAASDTLEATFQEVG